MRQAIGYLRAREWDKLQSLWVLPTARRLYLVGALGAIAVLVLALVMALGLHLLSLSPASQSSIPKVAEVSVKPIDPASLDALFSGPQAISIAPIPVARPVLDGMPVGRFSASTPWGLASADGIQLVGGRNLAMFREERDAEGWVLVATQALTDALEKVPETAQSGPSAEVRVLAKDANGNLSQPVVLKLRVRFKSPQADTVPPDSAATPTVEDLSAPGQLQRVVRALAQLAGPTGSPEYFDALKEAIDQPSRCSAAGNDQFNAAYVAAFDRLHKALTKDNVGTFYRGLCEAWAQRLEEAQQQTELAEAARGEVIARNAIANAAGEARKIWARALRDVAIGFAVAAIGFFMIIALFLAFLAMEGHSNALRLAVEALARERRGPDV